MNNNKNAKKIISKINVWQYSYRTVIPKEIIRILKVTEECMLEWSLKAKNDDLILAVEVIYPKKRD